MGCNDAYLYTLVMMGRRDAILCVFPQRLVHELGGVCFCKNLTRMNCSSFFLLAVVNNDHVGNAIIHWMSLGYSCIFIILLL